MVRTEQPRSTAHRREGKDLKVLKQKAFARQAGTKTAPTELTGPFASVPVPLPHPIPNMDEADGAGGAEVKNQTHFPFFPQLLVLWVEGWAWTEGRGSCCCPC